MGSGDMQYVARWGIERHSPQPQKVFINHVGNQGLAGVGHTVNVWFYLSLYDAVICEQPEFGIHMLWHVIDEVQEGIGPSTMPCSTLDVTATSAEL